MPLPRLLLIPTLLALFAGVAFLAAYREDIPHAVIHAEYTNEASAFIDVLDASGYPGSPGPTSSLGFRLATLPVLRSVLPYMTPRALVARDVRDAYGDSRGLEDTIDRYCDLLLRPGNRYALIERLQDAERDVDGDPSDIGRPTLILWGAEDRWTPLADARGFARDIADSRLIVYPGVGHLPMEELPGPTARATLAFLTGSGTAKGP